MYVPTCLLPVDWNLLGIYLIAMVVRGDRLVVAPLASGRGRSHYSQAGTQHSKYICARSQQDREPEAGAPAAGQSVTRRPTATVLAIH